MAQQLARLLYECITGLLNLPPDMWERDLGAHHLRRQHYQFGYHLYKANEEADVVGCIM
jgi:hypothetical protein